ncbi:MAG: hypothetical protein JJT94_14630 [Bernardetiaceae bacterium]|nr:hypothetical protein [Bernardetiaceae bacterium]
MIILSNPWLFRLLPHPPAAMALFPFVLLKHAHYKSNKVLLNHEKIHLRQQLELGIILFYILYLAHYIIGRLQGKNHDTAYRHICFEKEAYQNEKNLNYLKYRKFGQVFFNRR